MSTVSAASSRRPAEGSAVVAEVMLLSILAQTKSASNVARGEAMLAD
jgi:hypothetical protein